MSGAATPDPDAAAHVFVADLDEPQLDPADRHHLVEVRRLRRDETVTASDGSGRWRPCRLSSGELVPCGDVVRVESPRPALTVAIALTKGGRVEVAVQKLTELGIDRVVPFVAARSVARWPEHGADRRLQRLRRVAREAAMQSRRATVPQVAPLSDFAAVAALPGAALAERHGEPPTLGRAVLLVGPEGGWAPEELTRGLPRVDLGPQVLRAETAAIAGAALLVGLRAGVVASVRNPGQAHPGVGQGVSTQGAE